MPSDANFIQCVCLTFFIPLHNVEIRRRRIITRISCVSAFVTSNAGGRHYVTLSSRHKAISKTEALFRTIVSPSGVHRNETTQIQSVFPLGVNRVYTKSKMSLLVESFHINGEACWHCLKCWTSTKTEAQLLHTPVIITEPVCSPKLLYGTVRLWLINGTGK